MKEIIGLWFIVLAICIVFFFVHRGRNKCKNGIHNYIYDILLMFGDRRIFISLLRSDEKCLRK